MTHAGAPSAALMARGRDNDSRLRVLMAVRVLQGGDDGDVSAACVSGCRCPNGPAECYELPPCVPEATNHDLDSEMLSRLGFKQLAADLAPLDEERVAVAAVDAWAAALWAAEDRREDVSETAMEALVAALERYWQTTGSPGATKVVRTGASRQAAVEKVKGPKDANRKSRLERMQEIAKVKINQCVDY